MLVTFLNIYQIHIRSSKFLIHAKFFSSTGLFHLKQIFKFFNFSHIALWGWTRFFWMSGLAKVKFLLPQLPHLTIWNKKLKKLLLWGTGLIWSKFSICSRKNNPIQPCKIHIFFPFIFWGKFFSMGPYYLRAPLCIVGLDSRYKYWR